MASRPRDKQSHVESRNSYLLVIDLVDSLKEAPELSLGKALAHPGTVFLTIPGNSQNPETHPWTPSYRS